ncbi:MAG: carboxypeptidase regulatory-like domain-containing protein [Clostridia bacterium]|nr:carboxypeptidase regulatory-like domain-containing protein [Clostridia bacterium]
MKRITAFLLCLAFVLGLCGVSASAAPAKELTTQTKEVYESKYFYTDEDGLPESAHNYSSSMEQSWYVIREGASGVSVTFSDDTETESGYDKITIYNANGEEQGEYSGTALAGQTITVEGDTLQIRLTSDGSVVRYGFRVTDISYTISGEEDSEESSEAPRRDGYYYTDADGMPESAHNYENYSDESWYVVREGAISVSLTFSEETRVENGYDNIEIYNGADVLIDTYTGTELAGQTITIEGDTVRIRLTSDGSYTHYGFAVTGISFVGSYTTYTAHIYRSAEDRVTVEIALPAGVDSGVLYLNTTDNLTISQEPDCVIFDRVDTNGTYSVSYEEGRGYKLEFSVDSAIPEGTTAFKAQYSVSADYELSTADVFVREWSLSNNNELVADQSFGDIRKCVCSTVIITVLDWDGTELGTFNAPRGIVLDSLPFNPQRDGREFIGWSVDSLCFMYDTTVNAVYAAPYYTVVFKDYDGTVLDTVTVEEGGSASTNVVPERFGFEFIGWSENIDCVMDDTTAIATYETKFLVGDANGDGYVNSLDAATILRHDAQLIILEGIARLCADTNWNGEINSLDAALLLRYDADLIDHLPDCPLYGLTADGKFFRADVTQTITFTVSTGVPYENIKLYDQFGNLLGVMSDDGTGADRVANDGVHTLKTDVLYYSSGASTQVEFYCQSGNDTSLPLTLNFLSGEQGSLSGVVRLASDRATAVNGACVKVYNGAALYTTVYTNENGQYSFTLPNGNYKVVVSANGYIDFVAFASIENGYDTYLETFLMVENTGVSEGSATGVIKNSLTGIGEGGVSISFVKNWSNYAPNARVIGTALTDEDGQYSVELPLGNYTAVLNKNGFTTAYFNVVVCEGTLANQDGVITPVIEDGELGDSYLITLTWDENPRDLDSHVRGPLSGGGSFHVYFSDKTQDDGDRQICNLDYDDVNSYGPEHITLVPTTEGAYYYYIYKYSGTGSLATSGARVTIERGNRLIATFNVPTDQGEGRYWNIFAIKDGEVIIENTVTNDYDTSYAE